ncbi:MAG TPA: dynamin family protein [Acidimicrobiales bacterium]|nr:dynamin family protein [Acidimicrobiales bacterium]
MSFADEVRALAQGTVAEVGDHPAAAALRDGLERFDEPLRVAIAGRVKAGKSTLLNALVGEELAPTDVGECTRIVTWYHDGITYRVTVHPIDGLPRPARFSRDDGALVIDLAGTPADDIARLDVEWPSSRLRTMTLVDTPGIDSISIDVSGRTTALLAPDDGRPTEVDAVVYLMRHAHASDVRFLEAFHDDALARPTPVNAIGVLARADEVGACRLDAMDSATRIADRYRREPKLRRLVQTVLPVAGLVAVAGATLAEREFRLLARLAELDAERRDELLLTADRFLVDDPALPVTAVERDDLLDRLGWFGVRHAMARLAVGGVDSSAELSRSLLEVSGIEQLRRVLVERFGARADTLKARSLLATLEAMAPSLPGEVAARVDREIERITASARELLEIRLLDAVRGGALRVREVELDALERLAGGGPVTARLGLDPDASPDATRAAALAALGQWQARAENPMSDRAVVEAARVAVHLCEHLVASA